jgi:transcriptional regulator with PAS, ATPase and Fis domain
MLKKAQGGTLFLDEISMLDRATQVKLLGFLQTREYVPPGSKTQEKVDVRIIVSTNSDLESMIDEGTFLRDLYYRLNVVPIIIPALRERTEDLDSLLKIILSRFNLEYGKRIRTVTQEVLSLFKQNDWPGNVREFENVIGRAMIKVSQSEEILNIENFDFLMISANRKESYTQESYKGKLHEVLGRIEKQAISQYLFKNEGNRERTAKELGISLRSLYYKIRQYQIKQP